MAKNKKRNVPDIPDFLPVSIVDNHTHISPDPQVETGENGVALPLVQARTDDGALKPPILLDTLLTGMERGGIRAAITSGCELPELEFSVRIAREHAQIWAALAIHPNEAAMHAGVREESPDGLAHQSLAHHQQFSLDEAIAQVARLCADDAVVAVGETGLDYFRTGQAGKGAQKEAFRAHIVLAKELGKPLQIHDRDAHADVVDILLRDGAPEATVFHCFSGDRELAEICAQNGWYASFAGPITYPANEYLREAFLAMPPELVLVETDAPYLTPVPFRGHPNVAWGAAYTARFQAQLREIPLVSWCEQLNYNTLNVYGI
ncbi:TatD DNase family protein [Arcanobacterium pluranimalium]|uniref:TatD family hydrolase n=1 Tax=Arcanobacterium pluranimalium TaxID=108028 RepID=UPI00195AFA9F|nr:TatD family hydrolase [Arcanobacterium pluranimalium]MBM7824770.1 TatD DNase family protein [Arcanobacterium pluranimalium]